MRLGIHWKLLLLLLTIALVPLVVISRLSHASMKHLGRHLAAVTRRALVENAQDELAHLVADFGEILQRDKKALEYAVACQAREVERRLADSPPPSRRLYFSSDYDAAGDLPTGLEASHRHFRTGTDGRRLPLQVTYDEQVYFVVQGVNKQAVGDDLLRLSTMPKVYRFIHRSNPGLMYWQYTSLQSGFHTSFPGHGGYPAEYDPRTRKWYQEAKKADSVMWIVMPEVSTRTVTLTVAEAVHRPEGAVAGVTAIDVPLLALFADLRLPDRWSSDVAAMLVVPEIREPAGSPRLAILAHKDYEDLGTEWTKPVAMEYLESSDAEEIERLTRDAASGKSGVRRMRYRGREALWAHGAGKVFPVIIVPYDVVVSDAVAAETYALSRTSAGLKWSALILGAVVILVAAAAFVSSRSVTKPVRDLAKATERLAGGDFGAHVVIRTGDELQDLGEAFNRTGPRLRESERMRQSLAVAMEIQQQLLPHAPPALPGLEIAGKAIYCDETGGDYYDFMELVSLGPSRVGIAVGDVTGHGIGAALLMASARGVLRSHAAQEGADLGKILGTVNAHLVRDAAPDRFMTLFYGLLDAEMRTLTYVSAGHDPALWLHGATKAIEELDNAGLPLGVLAEEDYRQAEPTHLKSGDVIVIGTDGIWEARNAADKMFGKARLREILVEQAERSAEEIHKAVVEAVYAFMETRPQEDDITLVVVKAL